MKAYRILGTVAMTAIVTLIGAGVASAQVVSAPSGGPVNVTTTESSNGIVPGSSATTFATIQLSANNGGSYSITSIPITVTPGSGASTGSLSNCQIMNASNQSLTTGNDTVNTLGSGTNIFTFDTPLMVTGATTTLTVSCNVASGAASGTTFGFVAGTPNLAPMLGITLNTIPSVPAGTSNALLAIITLDGTGSGSNASVSSIPLTFTFNGAPASDFSNCTLHSASNIINSTTGNNTVSTLNSNGSATTFNLQTPFAVPAGSGQLVELTCNVSSATPTGASVTVAVNPTSVMSTNTSTGASLTPSTSMNNGSAEPVMGTIAITAPGSGTVTTTTPGAPNTGMGGNAAENFAVLAISAAIVLAGGSFLVLRRTYR